MIFAVVSGFLGSVSDVEVLFSAGQCRTAAYSLVSEAMPLISPDGGSAFVKSMEE